MLQGQGKDARERGPSLPDGLTALGALPKRTITPFIKIRYNKTNQLKDTRKYSDTKVFSDIVSISQICSQEHSIKINDFTIISRDRKEFCLFFLYNNIS